MSINNSPDFLVLARHCEPIDDDPKSALSDEGKQQAAVLACAIQRFMSAGRKKDGTIISSTAPRASQTTRILAESLRFPRVFSRELERGYPEDIMDKLDNLYRMVTIVVGHEPSLQQILYAMGLTPPNEYLDQYSRTISFGLLRHGQAYVIDYTNDKKVTRLPD